MSTTEPFIIDKRTGGISDDVFVGIPDSSYLIDSCEIRSNPKSITISYAMKNDLSLTPGGYFTCGVSVSNGKVLMFTSFGEIFINISGVWTLAYTHAANAPILGAAEYNGYVYYATATTLNRVLLATLAATFAPTDLNWATFTVGDTTNHPFLAFGTNLYIGDGKNVASIIETVFDGATLTLPSDETVYQLTDNGAAIRVYTRMGGNDKGTLYYWDGITNAVDETKHFTGKVKGVANKDGIDYAVIGQDPILYYCPYQLQALKRVSDALDYPNACTIYKGYFLFACTGGVKSWGAYTKDFPECLNLDRHTSNGNTVTDEVTCILNCNGTLYIGWKNGTTYSIDKLSTTYYNTVGYFTTRAFVGSLISNNKFGVEVNITHKPLLSGETILVYSITDLNNATLTLRDTISGPTTDIVSTVKFNVDFNIGQLLVEMTGVTPYTSTPEIYNVYLKLEESQ